MYLKSLTINELLNILQHITDRFYYRLACNMPLYGETYAQDKILENNILHELKERGFYNENN